MKKPQPRQLVLFTALGLSLAATAWVSREDDVEPVAAAPRRATATTAASDTQTDWPGAAASARAAWPAMDTAARNAWGEATPVTAAPPPTSELTEMAEAPAPPAAPPFPYQLVGRLTDGASRAILNNAQRSAVVGVGEVVDGQWRVDAIEPGGLRLTFLPLGLSQFISFAAA